MQHLLELPIIRIVIWYGDGVGNERATIVVMENLRHIGFKGKFDIRYAPYRDDDTITGDGSGEKLRTLISGFVPKNLYGRDGKYIYDSGWSVLHPLLGDIEVTRLPPPLQQFELSRVEVTLSGACDNVHMSMCEEFNTKLYIQLQPTDYPARRYIAYMGNYYEKKIKLPTNLRLSPKVSPTVDIDNSLNLSISEQQVYRLCDIPELNSQLVYGIYERASCLNPVLECQRLLEAHCLLQEKDPKKIILFFPQKICTDSHFRNGLEKTFNNIFWCDLTNQTLEEETLEQMPNNAIIIAYTGLLQPKIFDNLMLIKTNFPPVVEGENARGICESYGRSYLYGGRIYDDLQHYEIPVEYLNDQNLHIAASRCLKKENCTDVHPLADYMWQAITLKLESYHVSRRQAYLQKPDAIEYVVEKIGTLLEASESSSSIIAEKFEEEALLVSMFDEILSEISKLTKDLKNFASTIKDNPISHHESQNSKSISSLIDKNDHIIDSFRNSTAEANCNIDSMLEASCTDAYTPVPSFESPCNSLSAASFERSLVNKAQESPPDKMISEIKSSEEAQKKEIESQEHATMEDPNKTEQHMNTAFMLGCYTFSVGICISYITKRQYQNTLSANPIGFATFCGFAVGAGLVARGSSLIIHSLFTQQGPNNKSPAIAQKPKQELTTISDLSYK